MKSLARIGLVFLAFVIGCGKDTPAPAPVAPTVVTGTSSEITTTGANVGGEVTADGNASVTARGIVYSTTAGPTTASSIAAEGTGTGTFTATLTGLTAGTIYYARAFATNSVGTSYGSEITFETTLLLTTKAITNISNTTADSGGDISSEFGLTVTARGICWSTATNPTIANSKTTNGDGTGSFTSGMTGLLPSTTYYVRAYATNAAGTDYGQQRSFVTPCTQSLAGNVSYVTVVTAARAPITPCQPSVTGTTTITLVAQGTYKLGDASFGQYKCVWNVNPAVGVNWLVGCNNNIVVSGADQYGILWTYSILNNNGTTLTVYWSNNDGDAGHSDLTRTGGWPLNLSF